MNKQEVIDLVSGEYIYVRESMCAVDIRVIDGKQRLEGMSKTVNPISHYYRLWLMLITG